MTRFSPPATRIRHALLPLVAAAGLVCALPAQAVDVQFMFSHVPVGPGSSLFGRTQVPGTVGGELRGLVVDAQGWWRPTSLVLYDQWAPSAAALAAVGASVFDISAFTSVGGYGLRIDNGSVTAANLQLNWDDPVWGGRLLVLNLDPLGGTGANAFAWNGLRPDGIDNGQRLAVGNQQGFVGASYEVFGNVPTSPVPESSPAALLTLGLLGLAWRRRAAALPA